MDLLKKNTRKTINEVNYLDLAKKKMNFTKPCPSSQEAWRFASKLAKILGDEAEIATSTRMGGYLQKISGDTDHGTFNWYYDARHKTVTIDFKDAVGTHKPKYVYPRYGYREFIAQIYTNERTGEVEVKYTANKNEAYAIENNDKAIERFRKYIDRIEYDGKDMNFEDFTNKPKKVYKI
jgi:hypothetical protein